MRRHPGAARRQSKSISVRDEVRMLLRVDGGDVFIYTVFPNAATIQYKSSSIPGK